MKECRSHGVIIDVIGFPGSGKSTLAQLLGRHLVNRGYSGYVSPVYKGRDSHGGVGYKFRLKVRAFVGVILRAGFFLFNPKVSVRAIGLYCFSMSHKLYGLRKVHSLAKKLSAFTPSPPCSIANLDLKCDFILEDTSISSVLVFYFKPVAFSLLPKAYNPDVIVSILLQPEELLRRVKARSRAGDKHNNLDEIEFIRLAKEYQARQIALCHMLKTDKGTVIYEFHDECDLHDITSVISDCIERKNLAKK